MSASPALKNSSKLALSGLCCGWTVQKERFRWLPSWSHQFHGTGHPCWRPFCCSRVDLPPRKRPCAPKAARQRNRPQSRRQTAMRQVRVPRRLPQARARSGSPEQPVKLLAGPSSSASVLYGFPAGRRFRLIGQEPGFAQLEDVKSGATGWIDEAALGSSPAVAAAKAASQPKQELRSHKAVTASSNPNPTSHAANEENCLDAGESQAHAQSRNG